MIYGYILRNHFQEATSNPGITFIDYLVGDALFSLPRLEPSAFISF